MSEAKAELFIVSNCLSNPGVGGLAYIIQYWDNLNGIGNSIPKLIEGAQGFRLTTNNPMEITSAIYGANSVADNIDSIKRIHQVNLYCTSEYLCNAVNQGWIDKWHKNNWMTSGWEDRKPQPVKNSDLWEQLIDARKRLGMLGISLLLVHAEEHSEKLIEKADKMAQGAANGKSLIEDEKYEDIYNRLKMEIRAMDDMWKYYAQNQ